MHRYLPDCKISSTGNIPYCCLNLHCKPTMSDHLPSVKEKLEAITTYLLQPANSQQNKEVLLNGLYNLLNVSNGEDESAALLRHERTDSKHGIAVSTALTRRCLLDKKQTLVFLQGIFEAIHKLKKEFKGPLHILYAGCGPMGTLMIPLLPLFSPDDLQLYLLDLQPEAIRGVRQVIREAELHDYIEEYITADATTYRRTDGRKFHMIVSEIMDAGLHAEPQFAVMRNLHTLLLPGGKFLPEGISLTVSLTRYEKEPRVDHHTLARENYMHKEWCEAKRTSVGHLFTLSKDTFNTAPAVFTDNEEEFIWLSTVTIPALAHKDRTDMVLFTTVRVFGDHCLATGDSAITSPVFLFAVTEAHEGKPLRFYYVINRFPRIGFEIG